MENYKNDIALSIKEKVTQLNALMNVAIQIGLNIEIKEDVQRMDRITPLLDIRVYALKEYPTEHQKEKKCNRRNRKDLKNKSNLQKSARADRRFPHGSPASGIDGNKERGCFLCGCHPDSPTGQKMKTQLEDEWRALLLKS